MTSLPPTSALAGTVNVATAAVFRLFALVSPKNVSAGDGSIKEFRGDGNPLRAYVDGSRLPDAVIRSFDYKQKADKQHEQTEFSE